MRDSPSNPQHFFKFIPPGHRFNLSIPKSFSKYLRKAPKNENALFRRGCGKWSVKIEDDWVFGEGWPKFVRENGVEDFDFVVFKYQGNLVFDIMVFDPTTCEREYPNFIDKMEVDDQQENSHATSLKQTTAIHIHEGLKQSMKLKRNHHLSQLGQTSSGMEDHPYFISEMKPYNIKSTVLHIPMKFARSNGLISDRKRMKIVLMDEKQRSWPAAFRSDDTHFLLTRWSAFKTANGLKAGDTFRLELIEQGEVPIMKFHNLGNEPTKTCFKAEKTAKRAFHNHCYFISTLKPYSIRKSILYLPREFSRSNCLKSGEMILKDADERPWPVKLTKINAILYYIGCGLRNFLVANDLKEGDLFKFELIENEKNKPPVVKFSLVTGKTKLEHREVCSVSSSDSKKPVTRHRRDDNVSQVEQTLASSGVGDHPYFQSKMTPYSIKTSTLYIPMQFARSNGLIKDRKHNTVILRDEKQNSWPAAFRKGKAHFLLTGWRDFGIANGLKTGDAYMLELIEKGKVPIMKFHLLTGKRKLGCREVCSVSSSEDSKKPITKRRRYDYVSQPEQTQTLVTSTVRDHPYFMSNITPYSIKYTALHIPMKFARSNGLFNYKTATEIILWDEKQNSWPAAFRKKKTHFLLTGWRDFRIANGLKTGDAYMLELIEKGEIPIMKFHHLGNKQIKTRFKAKKTTKRTPISALNNHRCFLSTLKPSSFTKSVLYLPLEFSRSNGLKRGDMILRDDSQRSWPVRLSHAGKFLYIGCGFKDFRNANDLKQGDGYKFELIENENNKPPVAKFSCMNTPQSLVGNQGVSGAST